MEIAIIGLGPWGLAVLERLVSVAAQRAFPVRITVIEPGRPGSGIFDSDDNDFMLLNTPCGQHVIHPEGESPHAPLYAESLYSWASREGYRWVDGKCIISSYGAEITPDDFLPRRLMGDWLNATYAAIRAWAPEWVSVDHLDSPALDVWPVASGREVVELADGHQLQADHVVIATGHTADAAVLPGYASALSPYPVSVLQQVVGPGEKVAVAGLGLVALDVIAALTVGRGGRFERRQGGLVYHPSGREPSIHAYSRSGVPCLAKATGAKDPTGDYVPLICTATALAKLRPFPGRRGEAHLDFRIDILPLLVAEMQVCFYRQSAMVVHGSVEEADKVADELATSWRTGTFEQAVSRLGQFYGYFDFGRHLVGNPLEDNCQSSHDYQQAVAKFLESDLADAQPVAEAVSPVKAGYETLRVLRDWIRQLVEFQGLTVDSYLDFKGSIGARIRSAVAGPPASRQAEFLALMRAGVVSVPFGPDPSLRSVPTGGFEVRSTALERPFSLRVDHIICGHLDDPALSGSPSPLIRHLAQRGRLVPLRYGTVDVGSVDLSPESHPIAVDGTEQQNLWIFGALTEGSRYFTQYVPSPKSRVRAFVDSEQCARTILDTRRNRRPISRAS